MRTKLERLPSSFFLDLYNSHELDAHSEHMVLLHEIKGKMEKKKSTK